MQKSRKPRMLVIAKTPPLHDRASGDYRLYQILRTLSADVEIDFLSTHHVLRNLEEKVNKTFIYFAMRDGNFSRRRFEFIEEKYFEDLRRIGVNPLNEAKQIPLTLRPTNDYDIREHLAAKVYDIVWVEFFYVADYYLNEIRRFQPWATVMVDTVDLHYKRLERQADYLQNHVRYVINSKQEQKPLGEEHKVQDHFNYSARVRQDEMNVYKRADKVIAVSDDDKKLLMEEISEEKILFIPNIHRQHEDFPVDQINPWHKRSGLVFVGNFYHNPNVTSAIYIKHELAPLLEKQIGKAPIYIVGTNPPYAVKTMMRYGAMSKQFKVTGHVASTFDYLNKARVSIAPVLFGAGMNGKIGEAMAAGVPVVTTPLGALGMGLTDEDNCLVGKSPQEFVAQIKRLYDDEELWNRIRSNAKEFLDRSLADKAKIEVVRAEFHRSYDLSKIRASQNPARLKKQFPFSRVELPKAKFPKLGKKQPDITVVLLTFNEWEVTELCLRSLAYAQAKNPQMRVEYLVVDNDSKDGTPDKLAKIPGLRLIRNPKNMGFAAGNNVGIEAARGRDVVILNNDTVVAPHWLARMAEHARSVPDAGIIGPSTNTEIGQSIIGARYNSVGELFAFNEELAAKQRGMWDTVNKISGLCMYIPRRTLNSVGLLDVGYGIGYFEDDDYCLRVQEAGMSLVWAKDTYVHHFGSMSFEGNSLRRDKFLEKGMSHFVFKWGKRALDHINDVHKGNVLSAKDPKAAVMF